MKLLVVSDVVNQKLYSPLVTTVVGDVDLIVSCGDLPMYYLDYLVSSLNKPLLYVCGNHDHYTQKKKWCDTLNEVNDFKYHQLNYQKKHFFGGVNIDMKVVERNDVLFAGLEGSFLYNYGEHQYNEQQMWNRILVMSPSLLYNKLRYHRYVDVVVSHAPPYGIHDQKDLAHRGFESFLSFIRTFKPKLWLHGHTHLYDRNVQRTTRINGTTIINAYDYQIIDLNQYLGAKK